jgi:hypothetical protein
MDPEERPPGRFDKFKRGSRGHAAGHHPQQQVIREQPLSAAALQSHRGQHEMEEYPEEVYPEDYYYYEEVL